MDFSEAEQEFIFFSPVVADTSPPAPSLCHAHPTALLCTCISIWVPALDAALSQPGTRISLAAEEIPKKWGFWGGLGYFRVVWAFSLRGLGVFGAILKGYRSFFWCLEEFWVILGYLGYSGMVWGLFWAVFF